MRNEASREHGNLLIQAIGCSVLSKRNSSLPRNHWLVDEARASTRTRRVIGLALVLTLLGLAGCGHDELVQGKAEPDAPAWAEVSGEQREVAGRLEIPVAFENGLGMRFVLIPPGDFIMGSPPDEEGRMDDEEQHQVRITQPVYLQVTEVTQAQYLKFAPDHPAWPNLDSTELSRMPTVCVSQESAVRFAEWLTQRDERWKYRLPSEAEWEYACRAGSHTAYYFGEEFDRSLVAAGEDVREDIKPVATYPPNHWGLYDMHGNVAEWCSDHLRREAVEGAPVPGERRGPICVTRGGGVWSDPSFARCAARSGWWCRNNLDPELGFRLLATLKVKEWGAAAR